jgi:hypothetical protein
MKGLTLQQVVKAKRTAVHPGPPERCVQFLDDGMLLVTAGALTLMLSHPDSSFPDDGWLHEAGCRCRFCRRRSG